MGFDVNQAFLGTIIVALLAIWSRLKPIIDSIKKREREDTTRDLKLDSLEKKCDRIDTTLQDVSQRLVANEKATVAFSERLKTIFNQLNKKKGD